MCPLNVNRDVCKSAIFRFWTSFFPERKRGWRLPSSGHWFWNLIVNLLHKCCLLFLQPLACGFQDFLCVSILPVHLLLIFVKLSNWDLVGHHDLVYPSPYPGTSIQWEMKMLHLKRSTKKTMHLSKAIHSNTNLNNVVPLHFSKYLFKSIKLPVPVV